MKVAINIGLGNNPVEVHEIVNAFKIFFGRDVLWRVDEGGMWKDREEDVLVLLFESEFSISENVCDKEYALFELMGGLTNTLTQEAIAFYVYDTSIGRMAFNKDYNGEPYLFDMGKFIEY